MSTPPFDTTTPNVARMYDYWLGGTDNFEADRQAAEAVRKIRPNVAEQALDNKRFQTIRQEYREHLTKMFTLAGDSAEQAAKEADAEDEGHDHAPPPGAGIWTGASCHAHDGTTEAVIGG